MPTDERARSYHRRQLWLAGAGLLVTATYLVALIWTGGAIALRDRLASVTSRWWLALPMMLAVLGAGHWLLTLPLRWTAGFLLPRRFGLLHQPLLRWLADGIKAALIGGLLAMLGAEVVYGLLRATAWWWLWSALAFFVGYALLAWAAPVWLVPLFYRLVPLEDAGLRQRLLGVAAKARVPVLGVWVADQSRKSRTANAAVVGLGDTRRIVLFDTLTREFPPSEVEAVLAHELGHQVHHDIERGLVVQGAVTLGTFWVAGHGLAVGAARAGLSGPADLAGLPLLGLIVLVLGLIALPLANGWSRRVERQADEFALGMIEDPRAFVGAMERLADLNLAERDPHPVKEFLLYSHPAVARRIARARTRLRAPD
jgi:STE24 endopeptidase